MKRWGGLLRREWALMKWFIIALLVTNLGIIVMANSDMLTKESDSLNLIALWFYLHTYMGILLIVTSYEREKAERAIWLHTPAPYMQLIGAKVMAVVLAVACSLLLTGTTTAIFKLVEGGWGGTFVRHEVFSLAEIGIVALLNTLFFMVCLLFLLQLYQVLKSWVGKWPSVLITLMFFNISMWGWILLHFINGFQAMKEMGPIWGEHESATMLLQSLENNILSAGLVPKTAVLTMGSVCLYGIFISILFVGGAILFEKKVRL